jgi:hypothetical protein
MTVEEINHRLDTRPYFELGLKYDSAIILPDSIKVKMINALDRVLPEPYADSVFTLSKSMLENIEKYAWKQCKKDTVCFEKTYAERYAINIQNRKDYYNNQCYSVSLILACGHWNIVEAIPYLEREYNDNQCMPWQESTKAALAKLGVDSIYQQIKESRTLSYLLSNTELDTVNNEVRYVGIEDVYPYRINDFLAYYLEDKTFLFDMLDLLYLKGQVPFTGLSYTGIEISLLMDFSTYLFRNHPHIANWKKLCRKYLYTYIAAEKDKELYKQVSTHSYKQKMIAELRTWIDENISFE